MTTGLSRELPFNVCLEHGDLLLLSFYIWDIGIFYEISYGPILNTHPMAIFFLESWALIIHSIKNHNVSLAY